MMALKSVDLVSCANVPECRDGLSFDIEDRPVRSLDFVSF